MGLTDCTCIIHLHSAYSFDGRKPIAAILEDASRCGIEVLMLTDHSNVRAREDGFEGWHGRTLLIVGEEIAPRFNHYLTFGLPQAIACAEREPELPPQVYIDRVNAGGGMGFIAHPDHRGAPLFHVKHYPWNEWSVSGYAGIGIWDFMTDWQASLTSHARALLSYAFPSLFLRGPCPETLERWDRLTQTRRVTGIGELDNHDTLMRRFGLSLPVFPFSRVMGLIRTHLLLERSLTGQKEPDIATVLNALGRGRAYVSLDRFRSAHGFSFTLQDGKQEATLGDTFPLECTAEIHIRLPVRGRIRLLRNGSLLRQCDQSELHDSICAPGRYRVEAYLLAFGRYRPWIFSNPIYVYRT
jgi:hypothetical protein